MPGRTGSWRCRCAARVLRAARRARVPEGGSPPPTARSARPRPGCPRPSAARWSARHPRRSPPRRPFSTRVPHQPWRRRYRAPVSEGLARAPPTEASADVSTPNGNNRGALAEVLRDAREHGSRQHSLGLDGKGATEGVAPRGVELGKHVVKKEDRCLPGTRAQPRPLRELEREDGGPLFSTRGEGRQWPLADRHGEILTMRTHERRPLPAFAVTLLDEQSAIALGAIISGRPGRLAGRRDARDRRRAQRGGRRAEGRSELLDRGLSPERDRCRQPDELAVPERELAFGDRLLLTARTQQRIPLHEHPRVGTRVRPMTTVDLRHHRVEVAAAGGGRRRPEVSIPRK